MIEVRWSNDEKHTVIWKFSVPWNWNEFYAAQKQVDAMIDSVDGLVDSIFIVTLAQRLPAGGPTHLRKIIAQRHKRHDMIVMVGTNSFLTSILRVITLVLPGFKRQLNYVTSIEEAEALLKDVRARRQTAG